MMQTQVFRIINRSFVEHARVRVSYVSQHEGSLGDQQWFLSTGHIHGVDFGRDKLGIRAQSLSVLGCL
ncbi:hypothetical protein MTR67_044569 [Solanum verrucosum]|uniref:Uncharacterized protein n=1 Tax=Solanum verrucosum TaxID=315347 RepID=A0AAF0ZW71_SOLVR|nr:hypothetical protein MTR67_044569 [Solanum verrucosum]